MATATENKVIPRLWEKYHQVVIPKLKERFNVDNIHSVPRLEKIVVSMGIGKALENKARIETAVNDVTAIVGQRPVITKAKKSVSGFKVRQGMPIGCKVTLRRQRMYEFLDRLITVVIPRIRDFRGLDPKSFDGRGTYNMGLVDQTVFPEVNVDKIEFYQGMNITIVTSAHDDEQAFELLRLLGMPYRT